VGNELLSRAYVLRYLEHLPVYLQWLFDGKYQLKIIDDNLNTFLLNETQWILLTDDGYDICSESSDKSCLAAMGEHKVRFAEDEDEEETKTKEYETAEKDESDPLLLKPKID
jgi:hypothetical protein